VTGFNVGLTCDTSGVTWSVYGNAYVGQQVTGDLIVNGAIDGKTITGATIQTAASNPKIVLDATALNAWNASGTNYFNVSDSTGVNIAATGTNGTLINRANTCSNSSFEVDTSGWSVTGGTLTRDTTQYNIGTASGKITNTATSDRVIYRADSYDLGQGSGHIGDVHTISAYVRHDSASSRDARIDYVWEDNTHTAIGSITTGTVTSVPGSVWTRISMTTTPASGVYLRIYVVGVSLLSTESLWVDSVQVDPSTTLRSYFDGNTSPSGIYTYSWEGAANTSPSYENKPKNITIKTGANAVWNPDNLSDALPGIGFVLDSPYAQTAGLFSDGDYLSLIQGGPGGSGGGARTRPWCKLYRWVCLGWYDFYESWWYHY